LTYPPADTLEIARFAWDESQQPPLPKVLLQALSKSDRRMRIAHSPAMLR
jgi:hypothetical protein